MAPRLKWWTVATAVALAAILAATIPPGPPTALLLFPLHEEPELSGIDGHLRSLQFATVRAEWELRAARVKAATASLRPGGGPPIALHIAEEGTSAIVDPQVTARVAKLWRVHEIPVDRIRTVVLTGTPEDLLETGLPTAPGICFARLIRPYELRRRVDRIAGSTGRCAIESRYGRPGERVRAWADGVGPLVVPEVAPWTDPTIHSLESGVQLAEWAIGARPTGEFMVPWWAAREVLACGKGRAEFCREAIGLGEWTPRSTRLGRHTLAFPSELPAALIAEMGPERFGELWRSDASIPESFERLTGRPFDPWAMEFVQRRIGRVERPTALGLGGWIGWLFWMGLLMAWAVVRLRSARAR